MLKKPVLDILNEQVAKEMFSANLYLSMSSFYHSLNLNGFANWMRVQAQEEMFHSMKLYDYIINRGERALISTVEAPANSWDNALEAFKAVLVHEQKVTESINNVYEVSLREKDHATATLIQWFITEQVEEEANVTDVLERLKMLGDFQGGLLMLDAELKTRVFTPPVTPAT